jgi:C4-dicarboxylate transporter, DctM subunit
MSPIVAGIVGFLVLFLLLVLRTPIGFSMGVVGFLGFWYLVSQNAAMWNMAIIPFNNIHSYDLAVLPLFLLMADIFFASGFSKNLYDLMHKWLGQLRGGLAIGTVWACAMFGAMSASALATSVTIGLVALPEMKRYKYDQALSAASVCAGGTLGILIPPSTIMIIYGILTGTSIGSLFIAGIIPGILVATMYMLTIFVLCWRNPNLGPEGPKYSFREKFKALANCGEVMVLVALVLGGLIIGWFTPTEAGAVGAFGAIAISLVRKRLDWPKFKKAIFDTIRTTGMIYGIMIGASIFNSFAAVTTIPFVLADFVSGLNLPPLVIMLIIIIIYILLGTAMDEFAMILLTIPIFFPLITKLGFDAIWFGIVVVRMVEIASISPPVGMSMYAVAGMIPEVPITKIFRGLFPFLISDMLNMGLLLFFPAIALFLPSLMK